MSITDNELLKQEKKIARKKAWRRWLIGLSLASLGAITATGTVIAVKYANENVSLNDKLMKIQKEINTLKIELDQWQSKATKLELDLAGANEKINELENEVTKLETNIRELEEQKDSLEKENQSLATEIEIIKQKINELIGTDWIKAEQFTWEISVKNQQIQENDMKITKLNQEITSLEDSISNKDTEIKTLKEQKNGLEDDLQVVKTEIEKLETAIAKLQTSYDQLSVNNIEHLLTIKLNALQLEFSESSDIKKQVKKIVNDLWQEITELEWIKKHDVLPDLSTDVTIDSDKLSATIDYTIAQGDYKITKSIILTYEMK